MDIEKLIERLQNAAGGPEGIEMCQDAAAALSTLQTENEKLRAERAEAMSYAHYFAAMCGPDDDIRKKFEKWAEKKGD